MVGYTWVNCLGKVDTSLCYPFFFSYQINYHFVIHVIAYEGKENPL
jgi:hypothetical protein